MCVCRELEISWQFQLCALGSYTFCSEQNAEFYSNSHSVFNFISFSIICIWTLVPDSTICSWLGAEQVTEYCQTQRYPSSLTQSCVFMPQHDVSTHRKRISKDTISTLSLLQILWLFQINWGLTLRGYLSTYSRPEPQRISLVQHWGSNPVFFLVVSHLIPLSPLCCIYDYKLDKVQFLTGIINPRWIVQLPTVAVD